MTSKEKYDRICCEDQRSFVVQRDVLVQFYTVEELWWLDPGRRVEVRKDEEVGVKEDYVIGEDLEVLSFECGDDEVVLVFW